MGGSPHSRGGCLGIGGVLRFWRVGVRELTGFSLGEKDMSWKRRPSRAARAHARRNPGIPGRPRRPSGETSRFLDALRTDSENVGVSGTAARSHAGRSPILGRCLFAWREGRRFRDGVRNVRKSMRRCRPATPNGERRRKPGERTRVCGVFVSEMFRHSGPTGTMGPLVRFVSDWCTLAGGPALASAFCGRQRARLFSWLLYSPTQRRSRSSGPRP